MKDICIAASSPVSQYDPQGQANIINPDSRPGFMFQLAGVAGTAVTTPNPQGYGTYGYVWTSSGDTNQHAWYRHLQYNASSVNRKTINRTYMLSVRCKQD